MSVRNFYNLKGFSLLEMMVTLALIAVLFAAGGNLFQTGIMAWNAGDANIRLQESLRYTIERIQAELRQANATHVQINDGFGLGSSDAITFSIPVVCNSDPVKMCEKDCDATTPGDQNCLSVCEWDEISGDENLIWGAPLTWGCKQASCMDADDSCTTFDYKYIRYWINSDGKLERSVLDGSGVTVASKVLMPNLSDLQFSLNGSVVTMDIVARETVGGRVRTAQTSIDLYLRN